MMPPEMQNPFSQQVPIKGLNKIILKTKYFNLSWWGLIIALFFIGFMMINPDSIIFFIFVGITGYYGYKQHLKHIKFLKEFAEKHGFVFQQRLDVGTLHGKLFSKGRAKVASSGLIGEYKKFPLRMFNYYYTVGSGKNKTTYRFTMSELQIEKTKFPHIVLQSKSMFIQHSGNGLFNGKSVKISLEKPFSDKYKLYTTEDYEIETLQIFTKELLTFLQLNGNHYSIEFANDRVYIYDDRIIKDSEGLENLLLISKSIVDKVGPLLKRLHDDFSSMHEVTNKK